MTACRNKASRAVTAALVGVLSVGAVPMVAMAAGVNDGAALQSADQGSDFQLGKVLTAYDGNNNLLDLDNLEFEVGDVARNKITVTKAETGSGETVTDGTFSVVYYTFTDTDKDGKASVDELTTSLGYDMPTTAGTYAIGVQNSNYGAGRIVLTIKIVNNSLQGAYVIDGTSYTAADGYDLEDTTITYDGSQKGFSLVNYDYDGDNSSDVPRLVVALGDKTLDAGVDFDVKTFDSEGNAINGYPMVAGDYTAILTGKNGTNGNFTNSNVEIPFTIEKLDLSKAAVTLNSGAIKYNGQGHEPTITAVEGLDDTTDGIDSLKLVAQNGVAFNKGHYTYTVTLSDSATNAAKASITGTGTASLDVVDNVVSDFKYGTNVFGSALDKTVYLSAANHFVFDADEVSAWDAYGDEVPSDYLVYEIVNEWTGEKTSDPCVINTPGKWNVKVRIDAEKSGWTYGGSSNVATFTVYSGEVEDATFLVSYDGKTQGAYQVDYNADNYLDDIQVKVYDADGNLHTQGTDYDVIVTKDGEPTSEIVDHGVYEIGIKSNKYDVSGTTPCKFTVDSVTLSAANVWLEGKFVDQDFLVYTGDELEPSYKWLVSGNANDNSAVWKTLPSDVYTVTYYDEDGKECKLQEVGTYSAEFRNHDEKGNFKTVEFTKTNIKVSDQRVYIDVPNDQWFSEYVYKASSAKFGYMTGYNGTKLFGPTDSIKRGDVAVVLFKMAGGSLQYDTVLNEGGSLDGIFYNTPFSDVDGHTYYAQAIQ